MFGKIKYFFFLLALSSGLTFAQLYESLEKEAVDVLLSLAAGNSISQDDITNLKVILFSDSTENLDSLQHQLIQFESESKNISSDSALVLFNLWYLHLNNTFYKYSKEKFFKSPKTKIMLFSISMSCYCTLELCKEQTIDLLNFIKEKANKYDYLVIDSFEHHELQIEYSTFFAPLVIIFNGRNKVVHKIIYDRKMITQLTNHLNNNSNRIYKE